MFNDTDNFYTIYIQVSYGVLELISDVKTLTVVTHANDLQILSYRYSYEQNDQNNKTLYYRVMYLSICLTNQLQMYI